MHGFASRGRNAVAALLSLVLLLPAPFPAGEPVLSFRGFRAPREWSLAVALLGPRYLLLVGFVSALKLIKHSRRFRSNKGYDTLRFIRFVVMMFVRTWFTENGEQLLMEPATPHSRSILLSKIACATQSVI